MIYVVTTNKDIIDNSYRVIGIGESLLLLDPLSILSIDTETTGLSPQLKDLLSVQIGNPSIQVVIDCTTIDITFYKNILENKLLIGHNLKFDLQFLYKHDIIPLRVYDTMIVEQFLHLGYPTGTISYSLKSLLSKRLNIEIDKSVRGEIIWRGLDERVIKYAAKDIEYLEPLMLSQKQECEAKGNTVGAQLECNFVPVIAYLEWCGIKLDPEKWKAKMKKDKMEYDKCKKALDSFLLKDPKIRDKYTHVNRQLDLFQEYDPTPISKINWASSQQVVELCKDLGFNVITTDKRTGEEKESVLEKLLQVQKGINDGFLDLYFKYKEKEKVITSFGEGHLNAINPVTSRIHTIYKQLGAASGRMSCGSNQPNKELIEITHCDPKKCSYPNCQQLCSDEETRGAFVAEEGNVFCSCDYSAEEARLGGDIYQDTAIIEMFQKGIDSHSYYAKVFFKDQLKDVDVNDIKSKYPHLRKLAKGPEFALSFGGGVSAIVQAIQCSKEEAETIIKNYEESFKGTADFAKKGSAFVREHGYITICSLTNHRMYWWDWKQWKEKDDYYKSKAWSWDDYRKNHKGTGDQIEQEVKTHFKASSKYDRMARNVPCQGTAAIILKSAMINFFHWIVENNYFNIIKLCALVHDEACIEYPKTIKDVDKKLVSCMEEAAAKYCKSLPIPAEASVGDHWIH